VSIPGSAMKRERLSECQNHRCCYCGVRFGIGPDAPTLEHVRTRGRHGTNCYANLVVACYRCNNLRGSENAYRFFRRQGWLRQNWRERAAIDPAWTPPPPKRSTLGSIWPQGAGA